MKTRIQNRDSLPILAFNAVGPILVSESSGSTEILKEASLIAKAWFREDLGLPLLEGDLRRIRKRQSYGVK